MLVAEDDPKMLDVLRHGLQEAGWVVSGAPDGPEALFLADSEKFDCYILDVNLPGRSGFEVCRALRDKQVWAPVLMLTARDAVSDRVAGLDSGADDYLVKPFAFDELLARVRALVRRGSSERPTVTTVADLVIDPATRKVSRAGRKLDLSPREYALLEYLAAHAGQVLTRTQILEHVWDVNYLGMSNVVDVYVGYLRSKVDRPFETPLIHTVRGHGYCLRAPEQ
jgi:two-component system OmpR family response regulator